MNQICFKCVSCTLVGPKQYRAELILLGHEATKLSIVDSVCFVPGTLYELYIKGLFAGVNCHNQPCVSPIEKAYLDGVELQPITIQQRADYEKGL